MSPNDRIAGGFVMPDNGGVHPGECTFFVLAHGGPPALIPRCGGKEIVRQGESLERTAGLTLGASED